MPNHRAKRIKKPQGDLRLFLCKGKVVEIRNYSTLILGCFVGIVSFVLYLQTSRFGLINMDDYAYVVTVPFVKGGLGWHNICAAFTDIQSQAIWMPLTYISYMFDRSLFGLNSGAMHVHNACIHATNAALLFSFLSLLFRPKNKPASAKLSFVCALGALFWALHPLRVEPVAWIAGRKELLYSFFCLGALIAWVWRPRLLDEDHEQNEMKTVAAYVVTVLCFCLACLCKPSAMVLPLFLLLTEYWKERRVTWMWYSPFLIGAVLIGWMASISQSLGGATDYLKDVSLWGRLLNAIAAWGTYLIKTAWPSGLYVPYIHKWPELPDHLWASLALLVIVGPWILWGGLMVFKKVRVQEVVLSSTLTLVWFSVGVVPTLGISNFGYHSHADRFTYLPAVGFSLIMVYLLFQMNRRWVVATVAICLLGYSAVTYRQIGYWKNDLTLFSRTWEKSGKLNPTAANILGIYFLGRVHDVDQAVNFFRHAFQINRQFARGAQLCYIVALTEAGDVESAQNETQELNEFWSSRMRSIAPDSTVQIGLSGVSFRQPISMDLLIAHAAIAIANNDVDLAKDHLERVLLLNGVDAFANYLLGRIALQEQNIPQAIEYFETAQKDVDAMLRVGFLGREVEALKRQLAESRAEGAGEPGL